MADDWDGVPGRRESMWPPVEGVSPGRSAAHPFEGWNVMSDARQGDGWYRAEDEPIEADLRSVQTPVPSPYEDPYAWVPPSWQRSEASQLDGPAPRSHRPAHRKRGRRKVWPAVAFVMAVVGMAGLAYELSGSPGQRAALPFTGPTATSPMSSELAGKELAARWTTLTDALIHDLVPLTQEAVAAPLGSVRATAAATIGLDAVRNSASSATGLLNTYVSQLGSLGWTSSTQAPSHALIESSMEYRNGFERIQAIDGSTTSAMIAETRSTVVTDSTNWRAALLAVMAALGITDPNISGLH